MVEHANDTLPLGPAPAAAAPSATAAGVRHALRWLAWSTPALPIAVLVHELGHLLWFKAFGFPNVRLRYASVSHGLHTEFWRLVREGDIGAAAQVVSFPEVGIATGTGILISWLTIVACAYHTMTRTPHPLVVAVGLAATLRLRIGIQVLKRLLFTDNQVPSGTDEGIVGVVTPIPEALLWGIGLALAIAGWYFIIRGLPAGRRLSHLGLVAAGVVAGAVVYVAWLGPWLLP